MALATRPKPTVSHKKRRGSHHRHSKHYLKPYWPYLPMLIIMAAGLMVNRIWSVQAGSVAAGGAQVTRLQALTGAPDKTALGMVIIASGAAFALFTYRHWRRVHSFINRGEKYIYRNGWVDVTATLVFTVGFILTRPVL
jgi:uncharacterized membrane protein YidH (DUF202 family)